MTVAVPSPYALGTYAVTASATSAATAKKSSASQNVTVIEPMYRLSVKLSGSGSVVFSSPAKTCTSSCTADYSTTSNATVTLTAAPASRYTFAGWSGACSGTTLTCTVTMSSDKSVSASFNKTTGKR